MSSSDFRRSRFAAVLFAAGALTACAGGPSPDEAAPSHMYAHYAQVGEIQDAVVAGDIDAARAPARWLASHAGDQFGAAGEDALNMMRTEAGMIETMPDIVEIGRSVARMGAACGDCHTATGGGPRITVGESPPPSANLEPHMLRHAWGADRLWEGLFAPSDAAWATGTGALISMALDFGDNVQVARLAESVHELSQQARSAKDPQERARIYGDFLETCAKCHTALEIS